MTISIESFNHAWELLKSRFNHACNQEIALLYFDHLGANLDDGQLALAIKRVILENRFFPSAQEILDKVLPSAAEQAEQAWEAIYLGAQKGQRPELPEAAQSALRNIGGFRAVELASERELSHLRRQFFESFNTNTETNNKPYAISPNSPQSLSASSAY